MSGHRIPTYHTPTVALLNPASPYDPKGSGAAPAPLLATCEHHIFTPLGTVNASSQAKYPPSFTLQIQLPQAPAPPNVVGARTASPTVRITFSLVLRLFSIPEGRCHLDAECIQCTPELRWGSSSHAPRIYCARSRKWRVGYMLAPMSTPTHVSDDE